MKNWVVRRSQQNATDATSMNRMQRRASKPSRFAQSRVYGPRPRPDLAAQEIENILGPTRKSKESK